MKLKHWFYVLLLGILLIEVGFQIPGWVEQYRRSQGYKKFILETETILDSLSNEIAEMKPRVEKLDAYGEFYDQFLDNNKGDSLTVKGEIHSLGRNECQSDKCDINDVKFLLMPIGGFQDFELIENWNQAVSAYSYRCRIASGIEIEYDLDPFDLKYVNKPLRIKMDYDNFEDGAKLFEIDTSAVYEVQFIYDGYYSGDGESIKKIE